MEAQQQPVDLTVKYKRKECDDLLKRKFFYTPSFDIYGGVSGLYDFGPLGTALKTNVEKVWRDFFVLEDDMLEINCSNIVPHEVLKTSGHVDKFSDNMVKDLKNGSVFRADKLIEEHVQKTIAKKKNMKPEDREKLEKIAADVENYSCEELDKCIKELKIKSPDTGNELSESHPFNLMFQTDIGPTGQFKGYLRPETAQGMFINFRKMLQYNNGRMPMSIAQIGLGFRNELNPRSGLLRVREFAMAEIEHFIDPQHKDHPKFDIVKDMTLPLYSAQEQETTRKVINDIKIGEAVSSGLINNQTLAYFLCRTYLFLTAVGIRPEGIRFRQHRSKEMAHYASDCWDAEIETSYGWVECVGHAMRDAFDLTKHSEKTKVELVAARPLEKPITVKSIKITIEKPKMGKAFKKDAKYVTSVIEGWNEADKQAKQQELEETKEIVVKSEDESKEFKLTADYLQFETVEKTEIEEKYIPSVIEPAFGIGRIVYCIFEHCFKIREKDAQRTYFDFPSCISPIHCSLLPLISNNKELIAKVNEIKRVLIKNGVSSKVDDSGQTVGKRYARTDECGIPYAITVDFDTLNDQAVTLRQLDTMKQVRLPIADVAGTINAMVVGNTEWAKVVEKYGLVSQEAQE